MKEYVCFFKNSLLFYNFWEIVARWCLESRKKISFHEKLKLLNSGKVQWIEGVVPSSNFSVIKELLGSKIFQWGGVI